ncbi:MAG: REP-associated tyrosine transposase [Armatimonadota bacterium]
MPQEAWPDAEWDGFLCRRHPKRLEPEKYRVPGQPVLVTICSKDRRPVLAADAVRDELIAALPVAAQTTGCQLMAWCLMPDHIHTLLQIEPAGGDILRFVHSYKSWTGRILKRNSGSSWERSFWDRHARSRDDIAALISYVLHNPVRAGLCERWDDWPYSRYCIEIRDRPTAGRGGT